MGVILISLLLKTFFYTKNIKKTIGSFVTHIGIIFLLAGGFITTLFSKEGYIRIPEGEQSHIVSDYHNVELAITDKETGQTTVFDQKLLKQKATLTVNNSSLSLELKEFIKNMEPIQRERPATDPFKGFARMFELKKTPIDKVNENNISGLTFQIFREGSKEIYSVFEGMLIQQTIHWENKNYTVELRPIQTELPFSIYLLDFKKSYYPGTDQERSYTSSIEIRDQSTKQKRVIKMNQPLRYRGWTFYQSSFIEEEQSETTILAVVKNAGRAFPYLSSLIICFGLIIHILIHVSVFGRNQRRT